MEKERENQIIFIVCFLAYKKALDCVGWDELWDVLMRIGMPKHLFYLVRNLYLSNSDNVRIDSNQSVQFKVYIGVPQCCTYSLHLFNIYGEDKRAVLEGWEDEILADGKEISNLGFADDTTLIAVIEKEMIELIKRVECQSGRCGLETNKVKKENHINWPIECTPSYW